jgi:hypothetical protein
LSLIFLILERGEILVKHRRSLTAWAFALAAGVLGAAATRADSILVADASTGNVLQFDAGTGAPVGGGTLVAGGTGGLTSPTGMALGPDGNLYVASAADSSVLEFSLQGTPLGTFVAGGSGGLQVVTTGAGGLSAPTGLVFGPDGNLYVASQGSSSVLAYDGNTGQFLETFVPAGAGGLSSPTSLLFQTGGDPLVASGTGEVLEYDSGGNFLGALMPTGSGGLGAPVALLSVPEPRSLVLLLIALALFAAALARRAPPVARLALGIPVTCHRTRGIDQSLESPSPVRRFNVDSPHEPDRQRWPVPHRYNPHIHRF